MKFTEDVVTHLKKVPEVQKICRGKTGWYRGKKMLKVSNGTPNLVTVLACEPDGQSAIHVYSKNCAAVIAAAHAFGKQHNVPVRG